jgi:predicted phosphoribosyltransferase
MFASRQDAGEKLARFLQQEGVQGDFVVGLPRGGVVVAAEVAHELHLPLDIVVVRKIGHPWHREYALGAIAENGVVVLDEQLLRNNPLIRADLDEVIQEENERLLDYQARFHRQAPPGLTGKFVILVDDGLATGATTEAAVLSLRKQNPASITVAAPVGSANAVDRLRQVADDIAVLYVDPDFEAVGRYYDTFAQTTDDEVTDLLKSNCTVTKT